MAPAIMVSLSIFPPNVAFNEVSISSISSMPLPSMPVRRDFHYATTRCSENISSKVSKCQVISSVQSDTASSLTDNTNSVTNVPSELHDSAPTSSTSSVSGSPAFGSDNGSADTVTNSPLSYAPGSTRMN
ncbi:hypothetical protein BDB01DRAFT_840060 [Pilobolus umbonatus]|nr:hypothetical protein BDB01DRAFT_840060 [Pilobolus umbonatus]